MGAPCKKPIPNHLRIASTNSWRRQKLTQRPTPGREKEKEMEKERKEETKKEKELERYKEVGSLRKVRKGMDGGRTGSVWGLNRFEVRGFGDDLGIVFERGLGFMLLFQINEENRNMLTCDRVDLGIISTYNLMLFYTKGLFYNVDREVVPRPCECVIGCWTRPRDHFGLHRGEGNKMWEWLWSLRSGP